jgi:DNA topoisomerase-2
LKGNDNLPKIFSVVNDRWEICLSLSPEGHFQHCSFVNSICTYKGGTHVDKVINQIIEHLHKQVQKDKNFKDTKLKPQVVKQNLWIFIKCQIENPTFDSQTKENMTLKASAWGSKCEISEKTLKEICKSGLLEMTINLMSAKSKMDLSRFGGIKKSRLTGVKKLDDANCAGKKDANKCTLILTEGDSAKALAVAGLGVIGRE